VKRYIVSGAPGAGKTVLIRELEWRGHAVVEEAATDFIALMQERGIERPWEAPGFIEGITQLQVQRVAGAVIGAVQFHDRSVVCTLALARYLGVAVPEMLERAVEAALAEGRFERRVLFVGLLGFIKPTEARRINLAESIQFEAVHWEVYEQFGFELVPIPAAGIAERIAMIEAAVRP
jgi:predicted ATPase